MIKSVSFFSPRIRRYPLSNRGHRSDFQLAYGYSAWVRERSLWKVVMWVSVGLPLILRHPIITRVFNVYPRPQLFEPHRISHGDPRSHG